ncbi:carbohydrate-binding protein, partial [bacterium]|nr:carbohydrate-binding protein [bacterium]
TAAMDRQSGPGRKETIHALLASHVRGRPALSGGTLVTDRGTLLRGCRISTDIFEKLPKRSEVSGIKNFGLNTIHLYAESFVRHQPGQLHTLVDSLVNWTERDSLYLVLTIGCLNQNGDHDYDFTMGFWNFYAPRYADRTHVVYEIHNEPHAWSPPYPDATLDMERDAYAVIRSHAPDTPVLLFSYAVPNNPSGILQDIAKLGPGIDWANAAVATHGYGITYSELENMIREVHQAGYAIVNTEPCCLDPNDAGSVNLFRQQIRVHETGHVSYLNFQDVTELQIPRYFLNIIEKTGLTWVPDFGDWPSPVVWDAYSKTEAEYYSSQGGPSGVVDLGGRIGYISNGDYTVYESVDFGEGAVEFQVYTASGGIGGTLEIRLNSPTGFLAGRVQIDPTGGWDVLTTKTGSVTGLSGLQKLVLKFTGGEWDLFDIDWFQFIVDPADIDRHPGEQSPPETNRLYPNFPNPFNSSTIIRYRLIRGDRVVLNLFNLEGRLVNRIDLGSQAAGEHEWIWTATGLPGGIYLCRLNAGPFSETRKLILQN